MQAEKKWRKTKLLSTISYLCLYTQSGLLTTIKKKLFENTVGKGENAGNQHFLLFPQCFLPIPEKIAVFKLPSFCRLVKG